jgi:hypothetical protein
MAPVLQTISTNNALPPIASEEHEILLGFVALQLLRTTIGAKRINSGTDKTIKQTYRSDPRFATVDMQAVEFGYEHAVLASICNLPEMLEGISDLQAHLLVSTEKVFITSDNPAFKYNQYCQQIQDTGVTSALSRGLQIFLPLAPHLHPYQRSPPGLSRVRAG